MTSVNEMVRAQRSRGWWSGFGNLLAKEGREWWETSRWLIQAAIWLLVLNGFIALLLWVFPGMTQNGQPVLEGDPIEHAVSVLFSLGAPGLAIGVIVLMQDVVLEEKQTGTAAWILSKPVTREAFILAKLVAHSVGVVVVMIALPGIVAYGEIALAGSGWVAPQNFLAGLGILALHSLFYLALTLLMGVIASSRSQVLGVSLSVLLGGMILIEFVSMAGAFTPWSLPGLGVLIVLGEPLPDWGGFAIVMNGLWTIGFIAAAMWAFKHHDV